MTGGINKRLDSSMRKIVKLARGILYLIAVAYLMMGFIDERLFFKTLFIGAGSILIVTGFFVSWKRSKRR